MELQQGDSRGDDRQHAALTITCDDDGGGFNKVVMVCCKDCHDNRPLQPPVLLVLAKATRYSPETDPDDADRWGEKEWTARRVVRRSRRRALGDLHRLGDESSLDPLVDELDVEGRMDIKTELRTFGSVLTLLDGTVDEKRRYREMDEPRAMFTIDGIPSSPKQRFTLTCHICRSRRQVTLRTLYRTAEASRWTHPGTWRWDDIPSKRHPSIYV